MLKRIFTSSYKSLLDSVPSRNFVIIPNRFAKESEFGYQPILDLYAKRMRKIGLDRTVLDKNNIVLPALRLRQEDDTLEKLRNARECPGVINARDEFPDIDLVFQIRQMYLINRRNNTYLQTFNIKANEELIRCTLQLIKFHPVHDWVIQSSFNRYIPGRPNLLYLPMRMKPEHDNKHINRGSSVDVKYTGLWVYSYNEDFPMMLEFNPTTATPQRGYRLGEFINTLPDGIEPHPRYKRELNNFLVRLGETRDIVLAKEIEYRETQRKIKAGIDTEAEEIAKIKSDMEKESEDMLSDAQKAQRAERRIRQEEKRAIHKKRKPKTLKKIIGQLNFTVKEGSAISVGEKQTKGGKDHKE